MSSTLAPEVTVVFGCYNGALDLRRRVPELCDVLAQRYGAYEVVAVEDGSSDQTLAILNELANGNPALRVLRNPRNMGKGFSIRNGILNSTGQVVVFVDSDMAAGH